MIRVWRRALACALPSLVLRAAAAFGQADTTGTAEPGRGVAGILPGDDWAVEAVWRLDEMGLIRGFLPAQRGVPITAVADALREALAAADGSVPGRRELVAGWYERFLAEYPGAAPPASASAATVHGARLSGAYLAHGGREAPGRGEFPPARTGALPLDELSTPEGTAEVAAAWGRRVAAHAAARWDERGGALHVAEVSLGAGRWALSAGRQRVGYGWAERGGIVVSGALPLDRVELATLRPVALGGWLRYLGPVALHTSMSRLPGERHPGRPYFWTARVALQPHPRFSLAVHRAAMFAGDSSNVEVTPRTIFDMLIGDVTGGTFENQIVSVAGRWRLPTDAALPLTAYLEWGTEDAAGAWFDVPGGVVGVRAPAVPGAEALSLAVEYALFSESCCGNPEWYRHHGFPGSWAGEEAPYGHPLGGHGSELSLHAGVLPRTVRLRVQAEAFTRDRSVENLYVPGRGGRSAGGRIELGWRPTPAVELQLTGAHEGGDGWSEGMVRAGGAIFLQRSR